MWLENEENQGKPFMWPILMTDEHKYVSNYAYRTSWIWRDALFQGFHPCVSVSVPFICSAVCLCMPLLMRHISETNATSFTKLFLNQGLSVCDHRIKNLWPCLNVKVKSAYAGKRMASTNRVPHEKTVLSTETKLVSVMVCDTDFNFILICVTFSSSRSR